MSKTTEFKPGCIKLYEEGVLQERIKSLYELLDECRLCSRECKVNRKENKKGYCKGGIRVAVSSYHVHFGEEKELVDYNGSGIIFFTHYDLRCIFVRIIIFRILATVKKLNSKLEYCILI
jgi:putative pyruvate formate lyase activating enzyme